MPGRGKKPCYQLLRLKWKNPVQGWSRGERHSNGPRVLMCPVYLLVMDLFVAQTPLLSPRNTGAALYSLSAALAIYFD